MLGVCERQSQRRNVKGDRDELPEVVESHEHLDLPYGQAPPNEYLKIGERLPFHGEVSESVLVLRIARTSPRGIDWISCCLGELLSPYIRRGGARTSREKVRMNAGIFSVGPRQRLGDFLSRVAVSQDLSLRYPALVYLCDPYEHPLARIQRVDILDGQRG